MMRSIKKLVPLKIKILFHRALDNLWYKREYDSPMYGFLWSLLNKSYRTEDQVFELPFASMPMGFRSRFFFDCYEKAERNLIKNHLDSNDSVLELGACIGVVSCLTNRLLSDQQSHIVVEANPRLIPFLETNRKNNNCGFQIEHCLVSRTLTGSFFLQNFIVSGSANISQGTEVSVSVLSLDSLCDKYDFRPNVLIMDIEGGEIDFISENEHRLPEFRLMIIEMHPFIVGDEKIEQCRTILRNHNFTMKESIGLVEAWVRNQYQNETTLISQS